MKEKSSTHKAEGLGNGQNQTASSLSIQNGSVPQFEIEERFLNGLKSYMQAGRDSRTPRLARIARYWERKITFSILVAQQRQKRIEAAKAKREALKLQVSVEKTNSTHHPQPLSPVEAERGASARALKASPSSLRIRVGVSPSPD